MLLLTVPIGLLYCYLLSQILCEKTALYTGIRKHVSVEDYSLSLYAAVFVCMHQNIQLVELDSFLP